MSLHKLSAGDGYTYLTRQVAAHDGGELGRSSLESYYSQKGERPGLWWGAGLASLGVSGTVSEAQMLALFGEGRHPDAAAIEKDMIARGYSAAEAMTATKLGRLFPVYDPPQALPARIAQAAQDWNLARGRRPRRRCRRRCGRRSGPARPARCSPRSTAARRSTRGSCPAMWRASRAPRRSRPPATT
jgi:hypothetical protein